MILLHEHWGHDNNRHAKIYEMRQQEDGAIYNCYVVKMYDNGELIKSPEMISTNHDGSKTVHSESYAESAAENWCLGYME